MDHVLRVLFLHHRTDAYMCQFLPGHPDSVLAADGIIQDMHERLQFKAVRQLLKKVNNEHQDVHRDFGKRHLETAVCLWKLRQKICRTTYCSVTLLCIYCNSEIASRIILAASSTIGISSGIKPGRGLRTFPISMFSLIRRISFITA